MKREINEELFFKLVELGIINSNGELPIERTFNEGKSDYSKLGILIQPWSYIQDHNLNYCDGDIIKRVTRNKEGEDKILDYQKIIHICNEQIRRLNAIKFIKEEKNKQEIQL